MGTLSLPKLRFWDDAPLKAIAGLASLPWIPFTWYLTTCNIRGQKIVVKKDFYYINEAIYNTHNIYDTCSNVCIILSSQLFPTPKFKLKEQISRYALAACPTEEKVSWKIIEWNEKIVTGSIYHSCTMMLKKQQPFHPEDPEEIKYEPSLTCPSSWMLGKWLVRHAILHHTQ